MDLRLSPEGDSLRTRLRALRGNAGGLKAASLRPAAILTALRMLLDIYPRRFRKDAALRDRLLKAFVLTVIPGADESCRNLTRMYYDADYPFYPYTGFLLYNLTARSTRLFGDAFDRLDPARRTSVLVDALAADDTTSRLFKGAILMAQVSYYAGIYDPDRGCPLIEFPGRNRGYSAAEISYPDPKEFLGTESVTDGNPP